MTAIEALIPIVAIFFVIGVPMIGLVSRYALRPLLNDLTAAIRGGREERVNELAARLLALEERLDEQDRQLERLVEAERFRQALESGEARIPT